MTYTKNDKPLSPEELEGLAVYASEEQIKFLESLSEHNSFKKAAEKLNVCRKRLSESIKALRAKAAIKGFAPDNGMVHEVPDPFYIKRISTLHDMAKGEQKLQWVIQEPDAVLRKAQIDAYLQVKIAEIIPIDPIPYTAHNPEDFLGVIPMGDPHAGLRSWEKETGEKFDLKEYIRVNKKAFDLLLAKAPLAKIGLILDLGDTTHADNSSNRTAKSGNALDVDGRHAEVLDAVIETKIYQILRSLEHFQQLIIRINRGNHDFETAYMISKVLEAHFRNEPRVKVETSPAHYWYYRYGSVMVGSSHGDGAKGADMGIIMATDEPEMWGQTTDRVVFLGHLHHKNITDYTGCTVEYVRTMAASSAWEKWAGYRSKRSMELILYDMDGEHSRYNMTFKKVNKSLVSGM